MTRMIASVHVADVGVRSAVGAMRRPLDPLRLPGLKYADLLSATPLTERLLAAPRPGRLALVAFWDDDAALDGFLETHPLARRMAGGWHARMTPLRVSGRWSELPALAAVGERSDDDEPAAVITLGRLWPRRLIPFIRAQQPASALAVRADGAMVTTGMARPPSLVATFSVWRTVRQLREYAYGAAGDGHVAAIRAHSERPFHRESAFIRLRPYASSGLWDGRDPVAECRVAGTGGAAAPGQRFTREARAGAGQPTV